MARTLTAGMQTEVAAQQGTIVHLIELVTSGGTTRLSTTPVNLSWNSETWIGIGGVMLFDVVAETADEKSSGVQLSLSAVDQTIIAAILNNHFRGRSIKIWLAKLDSDGAVVADPLLIFSGFQNAGWRLSESRDDRGGGTAEISTRAVSRTAELAQSRGIKSNLTSHQQFYPDDTFFQNVPNIAGKPVNWGRTTYRQHIQPDNIPGGIDGWKDQNP